MTIKECFVEETEIHLRSWNSKEKNIPNEKATGVHVYGEKVKEWHGYTGHSLLENVNSKYNTKV